jgi:hypothetical protein
VSSRQLGATPASPPPDPQWQLMYGRLGMDVPKMKFAAEQARRDARDARV